MEIQSQTIQTQTNTNHHQPLREGEVYGAKIQSRISANEAILSIRGQEVRATFSEAIPASDRVHVQIEGRTDDGVQVRVISEGVGRQAITGEASSSARNPLDRVIQSLGIREASPELKQAVAKFIDRNIPLTKDTVRALQQFIDKGKDSLQHRLTTVDVVAKKGLEPTTENLRAVHEALHGKKLNEQIREISSDKANIPRDRGTSNLVNERIARENSVAMNERGMTSSEGRQVPSNFHSLDHARSVETRVVNREIIHALENIKDYLNDFKQLRQSITHLQRILANEESSEVRSNVLQTLREVLRLQGQQQTEAATNTLNHLIGKLTQTEQNAGNNVGTNPLFAVIEQWKGIIQNEADLQQGLEQVQAALKNQPLPDQVVQVLTEGINQAFTRLEQGRELRARQAIIQGLQQAQEQLPVTQRQTVTNDTRQEMLQYITNEILQTGTINSKTILITEITERLAKATDEFKAFQRDVSHQLSRINIMIEQFRAQSVQQTKPMLDKAIQQLDRALLKSDWLLFADMKTEKTVLKASSQLAEARKLLARGEYHQARQIVREVQATIDKLMFKPANQKVQHFLTREHEWQQARPETHRLSHQYEQIARSMAQNQGSAREIFEGLRGLGLNREAELAQVLVNKGQITEEHQRDLKSLFMRLSRGEEEGSKLQQQAQQTVQNIAGQQLMGRMDHQQNMQLLLFQLPVLLKGQAENLQVFVNSRNNNEKLDWENCSLYFLIETKKLGELGIAIHVVERGLTVTLKNDTPFFKEKVEPIAEKYLDRMKDIGFQVNGLKFSKLTAEEAVQKEEKQPEQLVPTMTKKGFDYKI